MARFAAALSQHPVTAHAVGEAAGQVLERLGEEPDIAMLFVTRPHAGALEDAAAAVRSILRPRTLIGCAAESVAGPGQEIEQDPAVTLWAARLPAVAPLELQILRTDQGLGLAGWPDELPFEPAAVVLVADPYSFPAEGFFSWLAEAHPKVPVVGGMASAALGPGGNRLAIDDRVRTHGAVGALLGPGVEVGTTVQFHVRDAEAGDEELRSLLSGQEAEGALLFTCNGRGSRLFGVPDHDAGVAADLLGAPPLSGFFCQGEFGPVGGRNFLHGFTASLALFQSR